ncbi:hypothetical protein N0V90_012482 [Kalmusia sp. IMI 367209]|nr:hypothetical protein N0V90_012482 [Kalmusia sp. IMI 367209]
MPSFFNSVITATAVLYAGLSVAQSNEQITEEFKGNLSSGAAIYFPSDANWQTETTQRWDVFPPSNPVYIAAIKPSTPEDVSAIVKIAAQNNISYLATGGGHGFPTTLGRLNDGISIDLSNFKTINLDKTKSTVKVGGGAIFANLVDVVINAGYELVTGACSCVGATGAAVGGGIGRLQGLHGLIADNVVSYKVVTADGTIRTVSNTSNPDLFWAMRGAGHNFGVILETEFKVYKATNGGKALNVDLILPASSNKTHWEQLKKITANLPAELSMFTGIQYGDQYGGLNILFNAVYYGPEADGRKLLAPFINNNPLVTNITYVNAIDVIPYSLFGRWNDPTCAKNKQLSIYTVGTKTIDVPTYSQLFADMGAFFQKTPAIRTGTTIYLETLPNQAVKAAPDGFSAYPKVHREILTHVLMTFVNSDRSVDTAVSDFANKKRTDLTKTSGFSDLEIYSTYGHGDEGPEVWYRDSLPRLKTIKQKYDPQNRFRFYNPIMG